MLSTSFSAFVFSSSMLALGGSTDDCRSRVYDDYNHSLGSRRLCEPSGPSTTLHMGFRSVSARSTPHCIYLSTPTPSTSSFVYNDQVFATFMSVPYPTTTSSTSAQLAAYYLQNLPSISFLFFPISLALSSSLQLQLHICSNLHPS